jgi:hypothetical protein
MGLLLAALAVVVVAVVVAVATGGGDDGGQAAQTTQTQSETGENGAQTENEGQTEEPHETVPAEPEPTRIQIRGGQVVGGPADIQVKKGDPVQIVLSSDAHDDIHLHG